MGTIGGAKREQLDFSKKVGLFEAKVIGINPSEIEYFEITGQELKEDSKATEYLGESRDGNTYLRVDFWLEEVKDKTKFKLSFFLEDKVRQNRDETKYQFINSIGTCSWAEDENDLPAWFAERDYRKAYSGEEDFFSFVRTWLGALDYRNAETTLQLDWKKLMKGNVKELRDQINGEYCVNIIAMATIISKEKDGEVKDYQGIYSRGFLATYSMKHFKLIDYSDPEVLKKLSLKKTKDLKPHERFVLQVTGEHGCKDFYSLQPLKEYDSSENAMANNSPVIGEATAEY